MSRIRVGVIGAGMISQLEHVPNLLALDGLYEVVGVADPSAVSRQFIADSFGLRGFATPEELLGERLDAVVIGSPDPLHHEQVLAALDRGLHVFCEKPLCYSPAEIEAIIAARDAAGKIVQVGYMKRFDPAYRLALERLPGTAATLRFISVEVTDPDAWPFIRHSRIRRGADIPPDLIAAAAARQRLQIERAIAAPLTDPAFRGFANAYSSSLVHDVNAVHGILDALGVPDGEIVGAEIFADGGGGHGSVRLLGGQALWTMTHLSVPGLADYRERISICFDDAVLELQFPSPWLNHHPTRLTIRTSDGPLMSATDLRAGYEEAFVEELCGFSAAIRGEQEVVNPPEHAARDQALLVGLTRHYLKSSAGK